MELYEISNQAIFDEPVDYKGIKIYPITIKYYSLVKMGHLAFAMNPAAETDIELIGLPYMEYMMRKALKEPSFMNNWNILNCILELSFKEQVYSFRFEGDFLKLSVAEPTEKYNDETMCVYKEKLNKYSELAKDDYSALLNKLQIEKIKGEIQEIANEIFVFHTFGDEDFENIKKIICYLNDIDITIIDPRWEEELKKASENMAKINSKSDPPRDGRFNRRCCF